jgi:uncharacterized protein YidB (DUF937 family)
MGLLDKVRGLLKGKVKSGDQLLDVVTPALKKIGMEDLLSKFDAAGLADKAASWVNQGENDPLEPDEVEKALGTETVGNIAKESGLSVDQVKSQLAVQLPKLIDQLTPDGKLPGDLDKALKKVDFGKILGG